MGNVLGALASAVGGGALGAAGGLGDIEQKRARDRDFAAQQHQQQQAHEAQLQQLYLQRQELEHQVSRAKTEDEHFALTTRLGEIDRLAKRLGDANIHPMNAGLVYDEQQKNPQALSALTKAAATTSAGLVKNNQAVGSINGPEYDAMGGFTVENKNFNPFVGQGSGSGALVQKGRMLRGAIDQILRAKSNAYASYSKQPGVAQLLASIDPAVNEGARKQADAFSIAEARKTAAGALNTIRAAYPNDPEVAAMTVEDLLGEVNAAGTSSPTGGHPAGGDAFNIFGNSNPSKMRPQAAPSAPPAMDLFGSGGSVPPIAPAGPIKKKPELDAMNLFKIPPEY